MSYWCPICEKTIPVKSPLPQAKGMVRSNHLRSHGVYTSRMTLEQKKNPEYILAHWKLLQLLSAYRSTAASLILTTPRRE